MQAYFTNNLRGFLIILGIGVLGLSALFTHQVSRVRGSFRPYQKPTLWYLVLSLLFFAAIATTSGVIMADKIFLYPYEPLSLFIFYQAYFLLLGIVHFHIMHHYLHWSGDEKSFWVEVLFTLIVSMFGSISFVIIYQYFNKEGLELIMVTSTCFFIVPLFFYHTFKKAVSIPPRLVKHWFYPVNQKIEEPDESKLTNMLIISFEFQKHTRDTLFTNFRAKAPLYMEFGQLFYFFINDYNERHMDNKIQFINEAGEPYEWIFYKKHRWYTIITHYIDAENTNYVNHIRENDVIICNRVLK
jgi:hypothetical protein